MIKDKDALISYYFYLEGYLKFNEQIPLTVEKVWNY